MGVQRNAGATNTITTASTVDTVTVGAASTTTITEAIITTEDDEHDKLPVCLHKLVTLKRTYSVINFHDSRISRNANVEAPPPQVGTYHNHQ